MTIEDHLKHLEAVLRRLREIGLKLKPKKCTLVKSNCNYLGHMVGRGEVRPLEAKVETVKNYTKPIKKRDMRAFLWLSNYYRQFMPGYSL